MLLGIGLHAALSFAPIPWVVQDTRQSNFFLVLFETVHGFRMPLFFLVSGFFTAMLYRKRGLASLMGHRLKRIALPLALGMVTIIPATIAGFILAVILVQRGTDVKSDDSLAAAARLGDVEAIQRHLHAGADIDKPDAHYHVTPLSWASMRGDVESVRLLLQAGADTEARNGDGATALISAAFAGRPTVVQRLLEYGADPAAANNDGVRAINAFADRTVTDVVSLTLGLELDWEEVEAGRERVRPQLAGVREEGIQDEALAARGWVEAWRKKYHAWLHSESISPWIYTPVFHHLWFLWFLCWLIAGFAVVAYLSSWVPVTLPRHWLTTPWRWLWLGPLTLLPQLFMGIDAPTFGPDTSTGILPLPHLLAYYFIFFGFGAWHYDVEDVEDVEDVDGVDGVDGVVDRWPLLLPVAILGAYPLAEHWRDNLWLTAVAQVVYVWAMCLGMLGIFRQYLSVENPKLRYISDSSYWLYLAHVPLVFVAQALVRTWPLPAFLKFAIVCAAVSGLLLLSYERLVRYTWIGRLLNGPKKRPRRGGPC